MPLTYKPQGRGGGGALIEGAQVTGALLVGSDGKIASLDMGDPGQVLSVNNAGALAWITPVPGTMEEIPIAGERLGQVRSSGDDTPDSVAVNDNGHMTVRNLNVARLYVAGGDEWILQAGTAT